MLILTSQGGCESEETECEVLCLVRLLEEWPWGVRSGGGGQIRQAVSHSCRITKDNKVVGIFYTELRDGHIHLAMVTTQNKNPTSYNCGKNEPVFWPYYKAPCWRPSMPNVTESS